jgi:hypothetical protein
MNQHYQDARMHLFPDTEYEVDAVLGLMLVKQRKAAAVADVRHLNVEPQFEQAEEPPHYGAQAEPEPRQDETKYPKVKEPRRGRGVK